MQGERLKAQRRRPRAEVGITIKPFGNLSGPPFLHCAVLTAERILPLNVSDGILWRDQCFDTVRRWSA